MFILYGDDNKFLAIFRTNLIEDLKQTKWWKRLEITVKSTKFIEVNQPLKLSMNFRMNMWSIFDNISISAQAFSPESGNSKFSWKEPHN